MIDNMILKKMYGEENYFLYSNIIGEQNLINDATIYNISYKIDNVPIYCKIGSHFLNRKTAPLGHLPIAKNKIMTFRFFVNNTAILNPSGFRGLKIFKLVFDRIENILSRQNEIGFTVLLIEAVKDEPRREDVYRKFFKRKNILLYDFEYDRMQLFILSSYKKTFDMSAFLLALKYNLS